MFKFSDHFTRARQGVLKCSDEKLAYAMEETMKLNLFGKMAMEMGAVDKETEGKVMETELMTHSIALEMLNRMVAQERFGDLSLKDLMEKRLFLEGEINRLEAMFEPEQA